MLIEIKKINGELIHSGDYEILKEGLGYCVKNKISLDGAYLNGASLDGAFLNGASLDGASLDGAYLNGASLDRASLKGASLKGAIYSILSILKINFYELSDLLTLELMRWDCISCGEEKMDNWKNGGECPFKNSVREFYFKEKKELWISGKPNMNFKELFIALCKEKDIKI
jgi:hypothetical protein